MPPRSYVRWLRLITASEAISQGASFTDPNLSPQAVETTRPKAVMVTASRPVTRPVTGTRRSDRSPRRGTGPLGARRHNDTVELKCVNEIGVVERGIMRRPWRGGLNPTRLRDDVVVSRGPYAELGPSPIGARHDT